MAAAAFVAATLSSCGGGEKKEEQAVEEDPYGAYEAATETKASVEDLIAQGKALTDNSDCKTCHLTTGKLVGPSHTEVAEKYDFTQANVTYLASKIIEGGQGVWGEIPMTAHPDITQAEAEKMAMYVLSLDGETPQDL